MSTTNSLLSKFSGGAGNTLAALARELGVSAQRLNGWRARASIPASYWVAIEAAAKRRGIKDVTVERLAEAAAARAKRGGR